MLLVLVLVLPWPQVRYAEACAEATEVSVHPSHCVLLASKLYEDAAHDVDELADGDEDGEVLAGMEDFDKDDYIANEKLIFAACDYCLYTLAPLAVGGEDGDGEGESGDGNAKSAKQSKR